MGRIPHPATSTVNGILSESVAAHFSRPGADTPPCHQRALKFRPAKCILDAVKAGFDALKYPPQFVE
jgi:hypothetical protein